MKNARIINLELDAQNRLRALDLTSFIVEAPAGAGKTELLTQRYLKLLQTVHAPEEIIAITFTNKAAAEMRLRILDSLIKAANQERPIEQHKQITYDLSLKALQHANTNHWQLIENPARLRIFTIDSLCAHLARQMPLMSRFGSQPRVAEDADALYAQAAENTLGLLEDAEHSEVVKAALRYVDNNADQLKSLLVKMLEKRDQWLHHAQHEVNTEALQKTLRHFCLLYTSELNVLEHVRYVDWQLAKLSEGLGQLPAHIAFAGFDQTAPQEQCLREILIKQGVNVITYATAQADLAHTQHMSLQDQEAEYRAAVAWAKQHLTANPNIKLAIVVPQLNEIRNQLADLLDDVFYPASVRPGLFDEVRNFNFSLGTPLTQQPIIQAAINLLRMLSHYPIHQADISAMLLSPFWSSSQQEADARAMLDAKVREKLPMQFSIDSFIKFAQKQLENGLTIPRLLADLQVAKTLISTKKATPSAWAQALSHLLDALRWPGERNITSLEYQAINTWQKALLQFAQLEVLNKTIGLQEAVSLMQQICTNLVFQAETEQAPAIQILGVMEALSSPVDAMWVMHMNDHIWPPPARPNALLPAFIQRAARVPNADNTCLLYTSRCV